VSQKVILRVIDCHLTLYGYFNRSEIVNACDAGTASVSRAIKKYSGKCSYRGVSKRYEADEDFTTQFPEIDHLRYLRACQVVFDKE